MLEEHKNLYRKHLSDFARYNREYILNVRAAIDQRNGMSADYYKSKQLLDEKKNKKLTMDRTFWEIDADFCQTHNVDVNAVKHDPDMARRFMNVEVG